MKPGIEAHWNALALIRATTAKDTEGAAAIISAAKQDDTGDGLLVALSQMVTAAFLANPQRGFPAFLDRYADAIGQKESKDSQE